MEIWHRVGINAQVDIEFRNAIDEIGIKYKTMPLPGQSVGLIYFDIAESDSNWDQINILIKTYGASDIYDTIFSSEEILSAQWCRLIPVIEQGTVQPQKHHMAWKNQVYKDVCNECGLYGEQFAPFRVNRKLNPRKNAFLSLTGTYALLGINRVFNVLMENSMRGFESWEVILSKSEESIQNVKQIYITNIAATKMIPGDLDFRICPSCGNRKYLPHKRGYMEFEHNLTDSEFDILRTAEWFGSGKAGYHEILVSRNFSHLIIKNSWHGVRLKPVKLS